MFFTKKIKNIKSLLVILIVPVLFLVVGIATLKDYGINWDEPFHFMRGQAYLFLFLTGKKNYSSLPPYPVRPKVVLPNREKGIVYEDFVKQQYPKGLFEEWRSYYQADGYEFNDIIKLENGHPPLNDIMAALTNYVLFQRLHFVGDLESYHLFEIATSFLIVLAVALTTYYYFGIFPSIVAALSLAVYPLFFSESHFNIKDPPEAVFYGLTIMAFYFGIVKNKWNLILLSAIFAALAFGTKFNAFFLIPTLGIWLFFYLTLQFIKKSTDFLNIKNIKKIAKVILSLMIYPFIVVIIFYALWPYLWPDPIKNILVIFNYYRQIGLGVPPELSRFIIHGWDSFPAIWIFYTTPIPILVLSIVGFFYSFYQAIFKRNYFTFLIVIWFLVPIFRVSLPNASIYGGIRQIMEFTPPMAILAGIGAYSLIAFFNKFFGKPRFLSGLIVLLVLSSLFFVIFEMIKIHPNENVYFNQLIGGLSGAKKANIPYWGNSYGNAYLQGVKWLNTNAVAGAGLGLPVAYPNNLPPLKLRDDISLSNANWSGPNRQGEYEIELDFNWGPTAWYSYGYYDVYLNPVFEAKVDGISILKVWKNDLAHTRNGFEKEKIFSISSIVEKEGQLIIDLGKQISLTRITIFHSSTDCSQQKGGYIAISTDGKNWAREPEPIDYPQVPPAAVGINDNNFVFLFAAKKARYILLDTLMENPCLLKNPSIEIRGLAN